MLILDETLFIARGSERRVYRHPENPELCIKVRFKIKRSRDESVRELEYAQLLEQKYDRAMIPIALPFGWVETNLGRGLLCPLVQDDDGTLSPMLSDAKKRLDVRPYIEQLENDLNQYNISVTDLTLRNLVLQTHNERHRIILIDGYGFTNDLLKYVFMATKSIARIQTNRRVNKLKKHF